MCEKYSQKRPKMLIKIEDNHKWLIFKPTLTLIYSRYSCKAIKIWWQVECAMTTLLEIHPHMLQKCFLNVPLFDVAMTNILWPSHKYT